MLTATFSLVALMVEQKTAQRNLAVLQQQLLSASTLIKLEDQNYRQAFLQQFFQFDDFFCARNIESFVIPQIRKKTREADMLLLDLDSLSTRAAEIITAIHREMKQVVEIEDLCGALEQYCRTLSQRLQKEEELLSISQRIISKEAWFEMAAFFISQDAKIHTQKITYRPAQFH